MYSLEDVFALPSPGDDNIDSIDLDDLAEREAKSGPVRLGMKCHICGEPIYSTKMSLLYMFIHGDPPPHCTLSGQSVYENKQPHPIRSFKGFIINNAWLNKRPDGHYTYGANPIASLSSKAYSHFKTCHNDSKLPALAQSSTEHQQYLKKKGKSEE